MTAYNTDLQLPGPGGIPLPFTVNPSNVVQGVKNMGLEAGGAAGGQALGVATGPAAPVMVPVLGAIGGGAGNAIGQLTTPGKKFSFGEMMAAGAAGAVPGANVVKAGGTALVKQGIKMGAANVAAKAVQTGIDESRLPTGAEAALAFGTGAAAPVMGKFMGGSGRQLTEEQVNNSARDAVNAAWRKAGGKIDPAAVDKPIPGLQMLAGKEGMKQTASVENARVVTKIIRQDLGMGGGVKPILIADLDAVRADAGKTYDAVAKLSKQAASDLENLKQARFNARQLGETYKTTGNPAARQPWLDAKDTAQNLEDLIEQHATKAGKADLVKQLRKDRVRIAKSYDVEAALNPSNGQVDASILAAGYNGRNMTGGLQLVADVANTFPHYVIEKSRIGAPAVSRLGAYSGANALAHGNAAGAFAAGIPMLGGPARKFLLFDVVQNWAAKNPADTLPESTRQALIRFSALSAGRDSNPFLPAPAR